MEPKTEGKIGSFFEFGLALSATSLGLCLTVGRGVLSGDFRDTLSVVLLTIALLSCFAALLFSKRDLPDCSRVPLLRVVAKAPTLTVLCAALWMQFLFLLSLYSDFMPLLLISMICALIAFAALPDGESHWTRRKVIPAVALWIMFLLCATYLLFFIRPPINDLLVFQRDASRALLAGHNPYAISFPNIYGNDTPFYGVGTVVNGRVMFGFPYPPLSLLWVMPAQALFGDFRYAHMLALAIGAAFIAALGASRVTLAAALLLIFCTPAFFVLEIGWTEPVSVMLLCACVWCGARKTRGGAVLTGLLTASKQYLIFALPLMILLPPSRPASTRAADERGAARKNFLIACVAALLVTLPFFAWNPHAFLNSVLVLHLKQAVRLDALSYIAYVKSMGGPLLPTWLGFPAALGALIFCWKHAPRSISGYAASIALVQSAFFMMGKQAFVNYYYFIFAALLCAVAAAHVERNAPIEVVTV